MTGSAAIPSTNLRQLMPAAAADRFRAVHRIRPPRERSATGVAAHKPPRSIDLAVTDALVPAHADRELVTRMAAGDEAALGALHDRFAPLLHSVVIRIVGDAEDAEEVLEETFWQAWRQAARYEEGRGGIGTWLVMMARSRALDRVRSRRRFREERWEELPERRGGDGRDDAPTPLEAAQADELRRVVARAVAGLPPEQRETVELAYFRGMSQTEIAEATGQPLGTVKTRARLALGKLRAALAGLREDAR
jgi:RNA polymerase sigma-70 factor (ECF subfamily)